MASGPGVLKKKRGINHWLNTLHLRTHAARQELYGKAFEPKHIRKLMKGEPIDPPQLVSEA